MRRRYVSLVHHVVIRKENAKMRFHSPPMHICYCLGYLRIRPSIFIYSLTAWDSIPLKPPLRPSHLSCISHPDLSLPSYLKVDIL